jgi:hypothetical protein
MAIQGRERKRHSEVHCVFFTHGGLLRGDRWTRVMRRQIWFLSGFYALKNLIYCTFLNDLQDTCAGRTVREVHIYKNERICIADEAFFSLQFPSLAWNSLRFEDTTLPRSFRRGRVSESSYRMCFCRCSTQTRKSKHANEACGFCYTYFEFC